MDGMALAYLENIWLDIDSEIVPPVYYINFNAHQ
ncbi:uncharacterized protein METZ01_LOCUS375347 [marine metagenome]|uniref:Uncharacterized protein n=1 Tax=marine metagenome TaxID=408172 RepID=A0A382TKK9_9ZZZZ